MKRILVALVLLLSIGLGGSIALGTVRAGRSVTPLYTVAEMRGLLTHDPSILVGRTVLVRGILEGPLVYCAAIRPCPSPTLGLITAENESVAPDEYLPVLPQPASGPLTFLRSIPLLRTLISTPQSLQFGLMAIYRLQLRAAPGLCRQNPAVLCDEGFVLDTAPSPLDHFGQR